MAIRYSSSLDRTFHALGDPSRRLILETLSRRGQCSAGDLLTLFETSQPTISKHLRVMENAGLIKRYVSGRQHSFSLSAVSLEEADNWMQRHLSLWKSSLEQLANVLNDDSELRARDAERQ